MITLIRSILFLMLIFEGANATEGYKCTSNADCSEWEYCNATQICPGNGVTGKCRRRPQTCPMDYVPVIGCDGIEYSNACMAAAKGQAVKGERKRKSRHNKTRYKRRHKNQND